MGLKEFENELQVLSRQISQRKQLVTNEEMTKQSLIIPFLQLLGYNVFDPLEVRPEYDADFSFKKGEKVDYAIFRNNEPIIFIEAKSVDETLTLHNGQLARYFNATPSVKVAILTNGIEYHFFTDLTKENIMDRDPFYIFNIESYKEIDIENIDRFRKEKFDSASIMTLAEDLVYFSNLNHTLKELFTNPSDDFLRFLIKDFSNHRVTTNVIERFRPIVKKAINTTLLEIISEGLTETASTMVVKGKSLSGRSEGTKKSKVHTTEDEMKGFKLIKEILHQANRSIDQLAYKDTVNYFNIYVQSVPKWFIRLKVERGNKYVITKLPTNICEDLCPGFEVEDAPKVFGTSRVRIETIDQIQELDRLVIHCYDRIVNKITS